MYISSYNTYITANSTNNKEKVRTEESSKSSLKFSQKLSSQITEVIDTNSNLPVNYISKYKVLSNQQRLRDETFNTQRAKFSKTKALVTSKNAYLEGSKIFPIALKTAITINQTPQIDKKMSKNAQDAKEQIMKHKMVNTYIANDNYYKITA